MITNFDWFNYVYGCSVEKMHCFPNVVTSLRRRSCIAGHPVLNSDQNYSSWKEKTGRTRWLCIILDLTPLSLHPGTVGKTIPTQLLDSKFPSSQLSPVHMSCATLLHAISEGRENEETFSYSESLLQIWYNWVDASFLVVYWVTYPLPGCVLFSKEIF